MACTKGQAVADDRGLIGRIYLTGERTSWVILLTDLSSRVPVMIESSQRRAILAGDNTPTPALDLDLAGGTATPDTAKPGDRVLSTGDGGLLPAGVPVGVVIEEGGDLRVALFAANAGDYVRVLEYGVPAPPTAAGNCGAGIFGPQTHRTGASDVERRGLDNAGAQAGGWRACASKRGRALGHGRSRCPECLAAVRIVAPGSLRCAPGDAGEPSGDVDRRPLPGAVAGSDGGVFLGAGASRPDAAVRGPGRRPSGGSSFGRPGRHLGHRFHGGLCARRPSA